VGVGNTDRQFKSGGVDLSGPAAEVRQSVMLGDEQHQTMIYLVCSWQWDTRNLSAGTTCHPVTCYNASSGITKSHGDPLGICAAKGHCDIHIHGLQELVFQGGCGAQMTILSVLDRHIAAFQQEPGTYHVDTQRGQ